MNPNPAPIPVTMLDTEFVRSRYAAFDDGEYADWAFFENAGGSCIPRDVLDPICDFLSHYKVQPYAPYAMAERAGNEMDAGYAAIAELLGADGDELTIGPSTTLNTYVLSQAFRPSIRPGDEIVVTNQDHEANIGCWRRLEEVGAKIREWRIDPDSGQLDPAGLDALLGPRTRLVCFTLCSNVVGSMNDVAAITARVREAGALSVGDGVSFAPHQLLDVRASGLDFYLFSTYKTFATHCGVMWGRAENLGRLEPQGHFFNRDAPHYRLNPTGPQHAEIAALAGLRGYFDALSAHHGIAGEDFRGRAARLFGLFAEHESRLAETLLDYLRGRPDLRIVGADSAAGGHRAATVAFTHHGMAPLDIARGLADHRIGCGAGHFYARRCIEALGIDSGRGVVRVSMVHYNTEAEVRRLLEALDAVLP